MSHDQFAFVEIMEAAEEAERERADAHRTKVQQWFDTLPPNHKDRLSALFAASDWLTCQALSAAANDWRASTRNGNAAHSN